MKPVAIRRRIRIVVLALLLVVGGGTLGYWVIGLSPLNALYQTVTTVTTVGFAELFPLSDSARIFTIVLLLTGVGTVLYALGVLLEALIGGELFDLWGRQRMDRKIRDLRDHIIVCGWGRVGRSIADHLAAAGAPFVVIDTDPRRFEGVSHLFLVGDATDDHVLQEAGLDRARALVAATSTDTTNVFLTLSGRALRPDLFILARARIAESEAKLLRAGADRVVNPQAIGGARIAALLMQPHVAEFLDVITHEREVDFGLSEVPARPEGPLAGRSLRDARVRDRTGALILALRAKDGSFLTNPEADTVVDAGSILIAIGTPDQLAALNTLAATVQDAATTKPQ
jgi:voltage-gated potassium channel